MHFKEKLLSAHHHTNSASIVKQALKSLGQGNKGLAEKLGKDPSLISKYASGAVRPKVETLLACMELIKSHSAAPSEQVIDLAASDQEMLERVRYSVDKLALENDMEVIKTLYGVLKLANRI